LGDDPATRKAALKNAAPDVITFGQLVERYLGKGPGNDHKPSTQREDKRLLEKVIQPVIGAATPVREIDRASVTTLREALSDHPAQANAALRRLSAVLSYAQAIGWRDEGANPCAMVEHFREQKRTRWLTGEELARLGKVLRDEEARRARKDKADPPAWSLSASLLVELLLFTGCRPGEIMTLKWEDVDEDNGVLRLRDSKVGPREVALSAPALDLLREAPQVDGNPWVIPGRRKASHMNNPQKPWAIIRQRAKLGEVHLHDLRHTHASWAVSGGVSLYVVSSLLGHKQAQTTQRYSHLANDPVKQAADRTAGDIRAALAGKEGEIVPIRQGGGA
jgi:integrase